MRRMFKNGIELGGQIAMAFAMAMASAAGQSFWYGYILPRIDKNAKDTHPEERIGF